jgi:hypothetical protein
MIANLTPGSLTYATAKGSPQEKDFNHGDGGADGRQQFWR